MSQKPSIEDARKVINDLRKKLDDTETAALALVAERDAISYDALVEKDAKARKRLDEINGKIVLNAVEAEAVKSALREAERRQVDAQDAVQAAAERVKAKRAQELAREVADACTSLDQTARNLFTVYAGLRTTLMEVSRLGAGMVPSIVMCDSVMKRCLATAAMGTPFEFHRLPPNERHSFTEIGAKYAAGIQTWATTRLVDEQKSEAA